VLDHPRVLFLVSVVVLWLATRTGFNLHSARALKHDERQDLGVVVAATLTLLGLIIGFSFSMAIARYDLRKNYEEAEANAIGTEYARAGLLPAAAAMAVRDQLRRYVVLRILYYRARDEGELRQINAETAGLQSEMWRVVEAAAIEKPTPMMALAVSGMNDVLNSQGYTQSAWWNRIPTAAWGLMAAIAVFGNLLVGFSTRIADGNPAVSWVLPVIVSISFLLVADIDSPRGGFIHVVPQNLTSVSDSLPKH
jgi:hypothetical protein